jgi:hypothetical protein
MAIFNVKGQSANIRKLPSPDERSGWVFRIPGELLKAESETWSEEMRKHGIWLRCVRPTASEELAVYSEAEALRSSLALAVLRARQSMARVQVAVPAGEPKEQEDKSLVQAYADPDPGAWQSIAHEDKPVFWEELGDAARDAVVTVWGLANAKDGAAARSVVDSFRVSV